MGKFTPAALAYKLHPSLCPCGKPAAWRVIDPETGRSVFYCVSHFERMKRSYSGGVIFPQAAYNEAKPLLASPMDWVRDDELQAPSPEQMKVQAAILAASLSVRDGDW